MRRECVPPLIVFACSWNSSSTLNANYWVPQFIDAPLFFFDFKCIAFNLRSLIRCPFNHMGPDVHMAYQILSRQGTEPGGADTSFPCKWSPSYLCTTNIPQAIFRRLLDYRSLCRRNAVDERHSLCPNSSNSGVPSHFGIAPLPLTFQLPSLCGQAQLEWDRGCS